MALTTDRPVRTTTTDPAGTGARTAFRYVAAVTRIAMGFTFLWAFLDKTFGLGRATPAAKAWLEGGEPTRGFLENATGPFAGVFQGLAGQAWADWLFMAGLLGIGAALLLGVAMRPAAASGALLLLFMWAAGLPTETNPFLDEHVVQALLLVLLALAGAGRTLGLARVWERLPLVRRVPFLR